MHEFFLDELPEDFDRFYTSLDEKGQKFWKSLQEETGTKGYLTAGWPKEYGGLGYTAIEQGINDEEAYYWRLRWPNSLGLRLAGPATILFGTEEQKRRFLPPIAIGKQVWFEVFSEPDAGSDEANQQTRAIPDGDDYIITDKKPSYPVTISRIFFIQR